MPRVAVARELPVSPREGFDYIMDPANWETYWPALVDVGAGEWSHAGDRLTVVLEGRRGPVEAVLELDEMRPYERVVYRSLQSGLPDIRHERNFRERDGRLDYELVIHFEPRRGVGGIVDRLLVARLARRNLIRTLETLARIFAERAR
jgi:hypothetical protein